MAKQKGFHPGSGPGTYYQPNPVTTLQPGDPGYATPSYSGYGKPVSISPDTEDLFPLEDPGKAVRNFLRQQGLYGNPFSPALQRYVQRTSAGVGPSFIPYAMKQGAPETGTSADMLKDFIGKYISGEYRPSYSQTMQNVGDTNAAIRNIISSASGMQGLDFTNPDDVAKARAMMSGGQVQGVNPWQAGLVGNLLSPDDQAKFFLGSYLPTLGTGLAGGLGQVVGRQAQSFEDYLDAVSNIGQKNSFKTLLDMLTGSMGI